MQKGAVLIHITKKELAILECLWSHKIPISCVEIQESCNCFSKKAIYITLKYLQDEKYIEMTTVRTNAEITNRKPTQLYSPIISKAKYLESLLTSSVSYDEKLLPLIFQGLINKPLKQKTIDELQSIIQEAARMQK